MEEVALEYKFDLNKTFYPKICVLMLVDLSPGRRERERESGWPVVRAVLLGGNDRTLRARTRTVRSNGSRLGACSYRNGPN